MAEVTFNLPDLGEGLTEAEILEWKIAEGDEVRLDQEIVEVSTAKAVVVIPSPHAGIVATLHGAPGDVLEVGTPLITYRVGEEAPAEEAAPADTAPGETEQPAAIAESPGDERSPNLVGYGATEDRVGRRGRRRSAPTATPAPAGGRPKAKPPVRKLAKDLGVDLGAVAPSGPGGTITRDDVRAAAGTPPDQPAPMPTPTTEATKPGGAVEPVRGVRRSIAQRMEVAGAIPAASAWHEARVDGLLELRDELADANPDTRITPFAIVLRLVVSALRSVPALNAHWTDEGIRRFDEVHLGFAAATDRGLLVPVIRDAHQRSILELNAELRRLTDEARAGTIAPTELIGSTFTVTNYGALGMDGGIPLINAPEVAILGVGRVVERPVATRKGKVRVAPTAQLTLSFDHRVSDGAEAADFLGWVAERLGSAGKLVSAL
ncbi:MAG: dihydrolipoamide acetyltransferase family protein [Acidimicrobiia bacterium]